MSQESRPGAPAIGPSVEAASAAGRAGIGQRLRTMRVGALLAATIGVVLMMAVLGIGLALLANGRLTSARTLLLDRVGPSVRAALELENALVDEETGVRGYVLTGEPRFLEPYRDGLVDEGRAYVSLQGHAQAIGPDVAAKVGLVRARAKAWREGFVGPALSHTLKTPRESIAADVRGKALFDSVRAALASLQGALTLEDTQTRDRLDSAANELQVLLIVAAVLVLGGIVGAGFVLRRTITRPLARLGYEARRVAGGEFARPLRPGEGPREVDEVGAEIDAMRRRIVEELHTVEAARAQLEAQARELEEQARELRRSNAELEQFAYVASHDLQEPLRKVASFCQALQSRYRGRLDERADQYIDFAVDGAKRMQTLINDLLAFSRVGRGGRELEPVALEEVLSRARDALAEAVCETGATVALDGELPTVRGDRAQLVSLFQNLIANALKFRSEESPVVRVAARARARDGEWELSCADNGIGIEPQYAERIFLIFQRLHSRDAYEGSGIGLALCRKIVEYHGGHIWLDTAYTEGARFQMTLPIARRDGPVNAPVAAEVDPIAAEADPIVAEANRAAMETDQTAVETDPIAETDRTATETDR